MSGADFAQILDSSGFNSEDTADDKTSIKIGFNLYRKFGDFAEGLRAIDVLEELEKATLTESKKKHKCFDK